MCVPTGSPRLLARAVLALYGGCLSASQILPGAVDALGMLAPAWSMCGQKGPWWGGGCSQTKAASLCEKGGLVAGWGRPLHRLGSRTEWFILL